jgi:O-antigen/teichoic acid export membrane protein
MKKEKILTKVYGVCAAIIVSIILLACLVCKWPLWMVAVAVVASVVISSPATLSLQVLLWIVRLRRFEKGFVWMLLMASIPLLSFCVAWFFAEYVPGKVWFILLLGILSGYAGILSHGISVAQLFNTDDNES